MRIHLKGIRLLTAVLKPNLEFNAGLQIASTVLRVVVGVVMVHNGWDKLSDLENFAHAYVEYIGLPEPWRVSGEEQKRLGVRMGLDYPRPIVDFFGSVKANEKIFYTKYV